MLPNSRRMKSRLAQTAPPRFRTRWLSFSRSRRRFPPTCPTLRPRLRLPPLVSVLRFSVVLLNLTSRRLSTPLCSSNNNFKNRTGTGTNGQPCNNYTINTGFEIFLLEAGEHHWTHRALGNPWGRGLVLGLRRGLHC